MSDYSFTVSALQSVEKIWAALAAKDLKAAESLEKDIFNACGLLASQPQLGTSRPLWTDLAVKFWVVKRSYFIVFNSDSRPLQILHVVDGPHDIPGLLGGD